MTPETDAAGPALAELRRTGYEASTPGIAAKRGSGAARSHGDERAEVLPDDHVRRHRVGGLVAFARLQRRPVRHGQHREPHREGEKRRRDTRGSGRPRDGDPGEARIAGSPSCQQPPRAGEEP